MKKLILAILALAALSTSVAGQTTRPAPPGWASTVNAFAQAVAASEPDAAGQWIADRAPIHTFASLNPDDVSALLRSLGGATLLGAHAYVTPAVALAPDIAADFKAAQGIPPDILKQMAPDDEQDQKNAADVAQRWVADTLSADKETADKQNTDDGKLVGILVFWPETAGIGSVPPRALFVLFQGREISPGQFRISTIVYGDPLRR